MNEFYFVGLIIGGPALVFGGILVACEVSERNFWKGIRLQEKIDTAIEEHEEEWHLPQEDALSEKVTKMQRALKAQGWGWREIRQAVMEVQKEEVLKSIRGGE